MTTLFGPGYGLSFGALLSSQYNESVKDSKEEKTYKLLVQESKELLFVDSSLKDVESNITIAGECWKYRVSLPTDKKLSADTCSSNLSPPHLSVIRTVINTGFVEPDDVVSWNVGIGSLPSCTKKFIALLCSW